LSIEGGDVCALTVAPPAAFCQTCATRIWPLAQLYSARREAIRHRRLLDAAELARVGAKAGAALIAINPLHALFAQDRTRVSPYYPSDRRFLDPLYIDVAELQRTLGVSIAFDERNAAALRSAADVDYPGVHALKMAALERAFAVFLDRSRRQPDAALAASFRRFIDQGGAALARFCVFEAVSEARNGQSWRMWPQELREARDAALTAFASEHATRVQFHQFLQWLADAHSHMRRRMRAPPAVARLLPRPRHRRGADGAECWSRAASFVDGFSIGAPPDAFSREAELGIAAAKSDRNGEKRRRRFRGAAARQHAPCGALRIDHVMGLARLFVIPDGESLGWRHLSYPFETLLGQLRSKADARLRRAAKISARRHGASASASRAPTAELPGSMVRTFGRGFAPPAFYPMKAMACVSTHDLPTLEGWWAAADIAEKQALGLIAPDTAEAARAARRAEKDALLDALRAQALIDDGRRSSGAFDDALALALHAFIARTPSLLAMAQLDDLGGKTLAINLPGTDRERLNWRRRLPESINALVDSRRARAILAGLCRNVDAIPGAYRPPGEIDAADGHERFEHGGNEATERGLISAALFAISFAFSAHAEQQGPDAKDISSRQQELRGVEDTMGAAQERARRLEEQLVDHAAARERLNGALIESTLRLQETEGRAAEIEERLSTLTENERKIVSSLESRRGLIMEILTVLQRMGRKPPPALIARPNEILEAVRASLALGALEPQLRAEARQLQRELSELEQVRDGVRRERERLAEQQASLSAQRERLAR
jgi:glycogen operon protein